MTLALVTGCSEHCEVILSMDAQASSVEGRQGIWQKRHNEPVMGRLVETGVRASWLLLYGGDKMDALYCLKR